MFYDKWAGSANQCTRAAYIKRKKILLIKSRKLKLGFVNVFERKQGFHSMCSL